MSRLTIAAQTIKDTISAQDVGNALGIPLRNGRCQCPLHGGKDYNCVLYKGNRGFYCHVCKSGGDVIKFAMEYHQMQFKDAIAWFDSTFHLGLNLDGKVDPQKQREAEIALQRRKNAIEFREWIERMQFNMYLVSMGIVQRLEETRDEHRPRTYGNWDDEFYMAVRTLPEAKAYEEECLMDCTKKKENCS